MAGGERSRVLVARRGGRTVTPPAVAGEAIDSAAIEAFTAHYGERVAHLPPGTAPS